MIYAVMLGVVAGLASGMLPAIGNFTMMILFWPLLHTLTIYELVAFYMCMASISQYIGTIPSIIFGIPGESSSFPAVHESKKLSTVEKLYTLKGCASGSFFGTVVSFFFVFWVADSLQVVTAGFFNSHIMAGILLMSIFIACITIGTSFLFNLTTVIVGGLISLIGYNQFFNTSVTFGITSLSAGIPDIVVLTMLFGVPEIYQSYKINSSNQALINDQKIKFWVFPKLIDMCKATFIGFFGGLIPGSTTVASSTIAYAVGKSQNKNSTDLIWYSETANNAGAVSQMLPLLLFGVPIVGSEALLLALMSQQGYNPAIHTLSAIFSSFWGWFLLANLIGLLLSNTISFYCKFKFNIQKIAAGTFIMVFSTMLYVGWSEGQLYKYIVCILLLSPLTILLRNKNTINLVFGYFVFDKLLESSYRVILLI